MKYTAIGFVVLAVLLGLFRPSLSSSPALFHTPAPVMVRGEARFAALAGGGATGLRLVDFTAWQAENAALKAKLAGARAEDLETGIRGGANTTGFLTAGDLPSGMAFERDGHTYLALPEAAASAIVGDAGVTVDLKAELAALFARLTHEATVLAGVALALLFIGTVLVFRRKAFAIFLAPLDACLATALTLALLGEPITFFHILCFFLLIGLGIDYAIFQKGEARRSRSERPTKPDPSRPTASRVVLFSFLTSLVGFGLLAFTSFPVTRGMGLTLALGLAWAYLFARIGGEATSSSLQNKEFENSNRSDGDVASPTSLRSDGDVASPAWHTQREQSAGRLRILTLWYFYRFFGKSVAKLLFFPAFLFIYPFCHAARAALAQYYAVLGVRPRPFRHLLSFAWSLFDKTDACTLCKNPPRFTLAGDTEWMKGGCFLMATHVGCIEVLPALRRGAHGVSALPGLALPGPRVHAFQQMGHDAIFTRVFAERLDANALTLHAVEEIGVETAAEMQEAIRGGDIVLMAADRRAAEGMGTGERGMGKRRPRRFRAGNKTRELEHVFLGQTCRWPKGVFRFAKLMEAPVYAIVCAQTGWNAYEIRAKRLGADLLGDYVAFLEENVRAYPYQWYQFYPFFTP